MVNGKQTLWKKDPKTGKVERVLSGRPTRLKTFYASDYHVNPHGTKIPYRNRNK